MADVGAPRVEVLEVRAGVDGRGRARKVSRRALAICCGLAGASVFAFAVILTPALLMLAVVAGLGALASFLSLAFTNARRGPRLAPAQIRMDGDALVLDGKRLPIADVAQGWTEEPDLVHLGLGSGVVWILQVARTEDRARLLRAAGVSASERVLRLALASAASQSAGGTLLAGVVLALLASSFMFVAFVLGISVGNVQLGPDKANLGAFTVLTAIATLLALATYTVFSALRRRDVVVGTDGIAYRGTLRREFVPYASIAAVHADTRGVRLQRKLGKPLLLATRRFGERPLPFAPQTGVAASPAEAQRRVLMERIREAMAAGGSRELAHVALDRLDRGGRDVAAWREALGRVLSAEGDYREARISPEDLGGVIEDPAAPAERRVAAAVALSARGRDEARRRVRIAVQACADEDLQRALESAAEGEIDEPHLRRAATRSVPAR